MVFEVLKQVDDLHPLVLMLFGHIILPGVSLLDLDLILLFLLLTEVNPVVSARVNELADDAGAYGLRGELQQRSLALFDHPQVLTEVHLLAVVMLDNALS